MGSSSEYIMKKGLSKITEDDSLMPSNPYGVSKMAANIMALLYEKTLGLNIVSARPFFVNGPGKEGDTGLSGALYSSSKGVQRKKPKKEKKVKF